MVRRTWATAVRRRSPRIPLIAALTAAVALGVGLAALATWWISGDLFERASAGSGGGAVKASLPAVVGAVIAVALVVLYRRQKDSERAQFAQRFGAASTQLGDSDTAVRIAGVYAMAAADESPVFARRQQCIDVLCGYLRLPYEPDSGSNHLSEFVSTTTWSANPPAVNIEETRRQAMRQNDREVRDTIVRVLAQRLARTADTSWSGNDFDLTGVLFEDVWFAGARFNGRHVWFDGAVFNGPNASFEDVEFNAEVVSFDGANFDSDVTFAGATFRARIASFDGAAFNGKDTSFDDARFAGEYVSFRRVGFSSQTTSFGRAAFKCLRASFESPAQWKNVEFEWENRPSGTQPALPRSITPRPWPPYLVQQDQDDDKDG
ncbi:MAG TPA: pentapeptide repeat-containing protein [Mycobacterium sp.]|nr:pentapeptide repeat-containing protein [Mycobacterium sp.]